MRARQHTGREHKTPSPPGVRPNTTHPARVLLQAGQQCAGGVGLVVGLLSAHNLGRIPQVHCPVHQAAGKDAILQRQRREGGRRAGGQRCGWERRRLVPRRGGTAHRRFLGLTPHGTPGQAVEPLRRGHSPPSQRQVPLRGVQVHAVELPSGRAQRVRHLQRRAASEHRAHLQARGGAETQVDGPRHGAHRQEGRRGAVSQGTRQGGEQGPCGNATDANSSCRV
jgi:hypothetical protein